MKVLVLGGTRHVGRALVEVALSQGCDVTTINRGQTPSLSPAGDYRRADRTIPAEMKRAVGTETWDVVFDTWSLAPHVVLSSAQLLVDRTSMYAYVSSRSVYQWPIPSNLDESGPLVESTSNCTDTDYAVVKRGGELAVLETFSERALIARPGLIVGPYEHVGRLPWWLRRVSEGGRVLAPGPRERPLQLIDGRDLASWLMHCARERIGGIFNSVSRSGIATMGSLLESCAVVTNSSAEFVWVEPQAILDAGIEPWSELPIWLPPDGDMIGLHNGDVSAAYGHGLKCRNIDETIRDTWEWMIHEGPIVIPDSIGLSHDKEIAFLGNHRS